MDSLYFDVFEPELPGSSDEWDEDTQHWYKNWKIPCEDCKTWGGKLCRRCNFVKRKREEEGCLFSPELASRNLAFRNLLFPEMRHGHSRNTPETKTPQQVGVERMAPPSPIFVSQCPEPKLSGNLSVMSIIDRRSDDELYQQHDSISYRSESLSHESVNHRIWPGDLGDRDFLGQIHSRCETAGPGERTRTQAQARDSCSGSTPCPKAQQICMACQHRRGCPEDLERCTKHHHWCFPEHRDGCPRDFHNRLCRPCPEYSSRCRRDSCCDYCWLCLDHRDRCSKHSHSHYCHPNSKFPGVYSRNCYCSDCRTNVRKPEIDPLEEAFINWLSKRSEEPPPHIMRDCFRYSFNWHKSIKRRPNLVHYGIGLGGMSALSYGVGSCSPQLLPPHKPLRSRIWSMVSTSIAWGYEEGAKMLGYGIELRKALRELD